jgi:hypothetical protein
MLPVELYCYTRIIVAVPLIASYCVFSLISSSLTFHILSTWNKVHQGWFSEDHTVFYADDELDELFETTEDYFSRCYTFDVTDLENPVEPPAVFVSPTDHPSIDHNLYVKDGYIYQAAYTSGARIRKIVDSTTIDEVAYFFMES